MRSGTLRHRIRIEQHAETVGVGGERVKTWNDAGSVWSSIEPLSAREQNTSSQTKHNLTHKIIIRNRLPNYIDSAKARLVFGNRVFHVFGAMSRNERGIMTELLCEEVAGVTP